MSPYPFKTFQKPTRDRLPPRFALTNNHGDCALTDERRASLVNILREPCRRLVADRHDALLVPFTGAGKIARLEIQIARAQVNQLGHAHAGRVKDFDERAIAQSARGGDIGLLDEPLDFLDAEKLRQSGPGSRCLQVIGRIRLDVLRERREAVEAPHGCHHSRDRPWREPFVHQAVNKILEVMAAEVLNGLFDARSRFSKPLEIAAVTFEGVIGEPAFDPQVRQIRIDEFVAG